MVCNKDFLNVGGGGSGSDVISFRLELVIARMWLFSEVVVCPACTMTTSSMLR